MKISIFTPSHDTTGELLRRAHQSILNTAGSTDWEWIIVLNGAGVFPPSFLKDERIRIVKSQHTGSVGALKRVAVEECKGDLLVELDHDDELQRDALVTLAAAAEGREHTKLVLYSDWVQARTGLGEVFPPSFGWCAEVSDGQLVNLAPPVCARNLCEIFYAPNHVRAFTRAAYNATPGYRAELKVCDDQELMIQLYLAGAEFAHVRGALYVQHASEQQTQVQLNAQIQQGTKVLCRSWTEALVLEEARRSGGACFDLGAALGASPRGFLGVDERPGAHVQQEVFEFLTQLDDDSVFCLRAHDFLEHIPRGDVVRLMNEFWRVLRPGGWLLTRTPSTDGRGAWQDPTHVSGWNENTFWYYTRREQAKYVPEIRARFQAVRVETHFPGAWHRDNHIPYVDADLVALKGQHVYGQNPWRNEVQL